jgi:hypothetical protein
MHINCPKHYHKLVLPSGRKVRTKQDCYRNNSDDEELGFLGAVIGGLSAAMPALMGASSGLPIGTVANVALNQLQGGGTSPGAAQQIIGSTQAAYAKALGYNSWPEALAADKAGLISEADRARAKASFKAVYEGSGLGTAISSAGGGTGGGNAGAAIMGTVTSLLEQLPANIRQQISLALAEFQKNSVASEANLKNMVGSIAKEFQPQIDTVFKLLKEKQLQTSATNEHNVIVKNDKRWQSNVDNQRRILERMDLMEQRIGGELRNRLSHNQRVAAAFGIPPSKVG